MGISVAFVPLLPGAKVNSKAVVADIAAKWPDLPEATPVKAQPGQIAFDMGDMSLIGGLMPKPIPWGDLEGPCRMSWLWPEAEEQLRAHAGHLIVTAMGSEDPLARAKALTIGLAGILGACPEALGVYWGDATLVIPSGLFQDMAREILPGGLPLFLWIDFRAGKNEDGTTGGFTTGLAALGHMEFETGNATDGVGELRERLFGLANYVLENGPVIKDGNTVGADENEKIRVVYSESMYGHEGKVMRLDYQPVRKNRR
jgi:hypothetical protein